MFSWVLLSDRQVISIDILPILLVWSLIGSILKTLSNINFTKLYFPFELDLNENRFRETGLKHIIGTPGILRSYHKNDFLSHSRFLVGWSLWIIVVSPLTCYQLFVIFIIGYDDLINLKVDESSQTSTSKVLVSCSDLKLLHFQSYFCS